MKDSRVITWILGSIDLLIVLNLRSYKTTKVMWDYLKKVYNQDNSTRRFQLEYEVANYSQGGLSVQDYFFLDFKTYELNLRILSIIKNLLNLYL